MSQDYPLKAIVTGLERSGTTILARAIQKHPFIEGGFECGLLNAKNPADFKNVEPFFEWMPEQWEIGPEGMEDILAAPDFEEAYRRIIEHSPLFVDKERTRILDKTPNYSYGLREILDKVPEFVPCILIEKEIDHLWRSYKKRSHDIDEFCRYYKEYPPVRARAVKHHGSRLLVIRFEDFVARPAEVIGEVFEFIGETLDPRWAPLDYEEEYVQVNGRKSMEEGEITPHEAEMLDQLRRDLAAAGF